jgi:hypothetical protein
LFYSLVSQFLAIKSFYSFYSHLSSSSSSTTSLPDDVDGTTITRYEYDGGDGGALIWFNKVPEIGFELIVVTSVLLRSFAKFVRGEPTEIEEGEFGGGVWWDSTEDYAVVLIK